MAIKARRVAVIGAGPSGAMTVDALAKEQAFDTIRVFDRRGAIGGTWVNTPHLPPKIPSLRDLIAGHVDHAIPTPPELPAATPKSDQVNNHQVRFSDSALHEHLHSNIIPSIMSFTQEPFPETLSERTLAKYGPGAPFRHREVIREWVEGIFTRGGHEKLLELGTTVERAVKNDEGEWVLTLRKETPGQDLWWEERFDALVVASGHYNVPWIPDIPGLAEFEERSPGRVVHSKHFRSPEDFRGKRVIVVGGSVSAHEILHEILPAVRHPAYVSLRGEPIAAFGWAPFQHPHVAVKKNITRIDPDGTVVLADGTRLTDIDHIIFATGYTFSLPFLPSKQAQIKQANRRLPGVYQHTWDIEDPSLAFVGMLGGGFTFRVYEYQAVAVARHFAGRAQALPPVEEQRKWERQRVAQLGGGKSYYSIAADYQGFFEFLRNTAGDPIPGTTGRVLPPWDNDLLEVWGGMTAAKIRGFREDARRAVEEIRKRKEEEARRQAQEAIKEWAPKARL